MIIIYFYASAKFNTISKRAIEDTVINIYKKSAFYSIIILGDKFSPSLAGVWMDFEGLHISTKVID